MARRKMFYPYTNDNFVRKENFLDTKKIFIIACEGIATEPKYLKNLIDTKRKDRTIAFGSKIIIANHSHSDPYGVLQDLITDSNYDETYNRWIVIDRDPIENFGKGASGHPDSNFYDTLKLADNLGIKVAWSNPCFELWIVLHFVYWCTPVSRKDIQHKALELLKNNEILKKTDKIAAMKTKDNLYAVLESNLKTAIMNSEKLIKINSSSFENPCTKISELITEIF